MTDPRVKYLATQLNHLGDAAPDVHAETHVKAMDDMRDAASRMSGNAIREILPETRCRLTGSQQCGPEVVNCFYRDAAAAAIAAAPKVSVDTVKAAFAAFLPEVKFSALGPEPRERMSRAIAAADKTRGINPASARAGASEPDWTAPQRDSMLLAVRSMLEAMAFFDPHNDAIRDAHRAINTAFPTPGAADGR